jgi:hypothetical protein
MCFRAKTCVFAERDRLNALHLCLKVWCWKWCSPAPPLLRSRLRGTDTRISFTANILAQLAGSTLQKLSDWLTRLIYIPLIHMRGIRRSTEAKRLMTPIEAMGVIESSESSQSSVKQCQTGFENRIIRLPVIRFRLYGNTWITCNCNRNR